MKKFGLGVIVGVVVGIVAMLFIMRYQPNEINIAQETVYVGKTQPPEDIPNTDTDITEIDEEDISDDEIKEYDSDFEVSYAKHKKKSIKLKDENGEFTPEALELAQKYCNLYNKGKWDGASKVDSITGVRVYNHFGFIKLNSKKTSIRTNERIICDNVVKSYMSAKWDGKKKKIEKGYTIELDAGSGELLLNGDTSDIYKNLDIPKKAYELLENNSNPSDFEYVPGKGTYAIIDNKLVKFLRGKKVTLPGKELSWKGFKNRKDMEHKLYDVNVRALFDLPDLTYDTKDRKLYLLTGDKKHGSLLDRTNYVYVFNDIDKSEIEYVGIADYEKYAYKDVSIKTMTKK